MLRPVSEFAPAKLNLYLHVTGKRDDGYHLLESLVTFADFGDTLEFYPSDALSLEIEGEYADALPENTNNLILKAAHALKEHTGCRQGARIVLDKRIPLAAGLGGGSADAAATLRGLMRLWHLSVDDAELMNIALSLGSDVPACVYSKPVHLQGVGEKLSPVAWNAEAWVVMANPGIALPTKSVFGKFNGPFDAPSGINAINDFAALIALLSKRHNALEAPAVALCPLVAELIAALRDLPGCKLTRMTGSGATCFGLFESKQAAENAMNRLQKEQPSLWAVTAQL